MKKTIVTLIAGLFATAAFAQTPAPATPATSTPQSAISPGVAKAQAEHDKEMAAANAKAGTGEKQSPKHPKKHSPIKTKPNAPAGAQNATVGPTDVNTSGTPTSTSK